MTATTRDQAPVAIAGDGVELRLKEIGGGFSVAFMRLSKGMEMAPALKGLPDDLCQCPHWGYLLKGTLRMHTKDGTRDYTAGRPSTGHRGTPRKRWRTWSTWTSHPPRSSRR